MKNVFLVFILTLASYSFAVKALTPMKKVVSSMETTQLDNLIRGEMSAVKTYDQVLEKVKDKSEVQKLSIIRRDHMNAVDKLKGYANKEILNDTKTIGAWGMFTEAWTGSAKIFGNRTALKALTQGEEHGINEYKEALNDDNIKTEIKQLIKTEFLPKQEQHIKVIQTLM